MIGSSPSQPAGETYVGCLDCGRQFVYDWDHMRIGKTIERSPESGVHPDMPGATKTKIKYALLGSAIPLAFLFGRSLVTKSTQSCERPPLTRTSQYELTMLWIVISGCLMVDLEPAFGFVNWSIISGCPVATTS